MNRGTAHVSRSIVHVALVAIVVWTIGCGHPDRLVQLHVKELGATQPEGNPALVKDGALVKKRLGEVADLLGFDERVANDPHVVALFVQTGALAPVSLEATVQQNGSILVEVSQRAPQDSATAVFEKARLLVEDRLRHDFGERVEEKKRGTDMWSFIRSEDMRQKYP